MLAAYAEDSQTTCFKFIGANNNSVKNSTVHLISNNTSLLAPSCSNGGEDTCSFYSGPSEAAIMAFGESCESAGSIAYGESCESAGSIAYSGCGDTAYSGGSASVSCSSVSSGCSYSC